MNLEPPVSRKEPAARKQRVLETESVSKSTEIEQDSP